jgi:hypothetical protein
MQMRILAACGTQKFNAMIFDRRAVALTGQA